ncbi:MAG: hypothetical protein QNK23_10705 [Crocinitomicaceae bacterium]|nr:hypothetical protein [Crocinitomicaceae bacterium]
MILIFNIQAIFQAILGVVVVGLLHLLLSLFGLDYDMIGGTREAFVSLLIIAYIAAYTDAKGLKGKLFYLPAWIVFILGAILVFNMTYGESRYNHDTGLNVKENLAFLQSFLYGTSLLIALIHIRKSKAHLRKVWTEQKEHLNSLKAAVQEYNEIPVDFWVIASRVYFKPSIFFLYNNGIWKLLFSNSIDENEFLEYYRDFINLIDLDTLDEEHRNNMSILKSALNKATSFQDYDHPTNSLANLASVINSKTEGL